MVTQGYESQSMECHGQFRVSNKDLRASTASVRASVESQRASLGGMGLSLDQGGG